MYVCMCVCVYTSYDIRFPELYTCLAASGADVILVPSAFFPSTGEAHWEVLLRARAIENQASGWYISMVGGSGGNRIVVVVVV